MIRDLESTVLDDVMPDSIRHDKTVKESAEAIDPYLRNTAERVDYPLILKRIDEMTSVQLDHLARQYDATWCDSWSVDMKRSVLKATIADKRIVGTLKAVKNAVSALSGTAEVVEWWQEEPKGVPHTFTIKATVSGVKGGISAALQHDLIRQIDYSKPVRSWYTLSVQETARGDMDISGVLRTATYVRVSHLE